MMNKLNIKGIHIHDNTYHRDRDRWDVPTLIAYCKAKEYPVFKYPIEAINLDAYPFDVNNIHDFIYNSIRVQETNLQYPILVDDKGIICDGWHRVIKAILEGRDYVDAIRILEMPSPSGKEETNG